MRNGYSGTFSTVKPDNNRCEDFRFVLVLPMNTRSMSLPQLQWVLLPLINRAPPSPRLRRTRRASPSSRLRRTSRRRARPRMVVTIPSVLDGANHHEKTGDRPSRRNEADAPNRAPSISSRTSTTIRTRTI
jgi:hypothetical protein